METDGDNKAALAMKVARMSAAPSRDGSYAAVLLLASCRVAAKECGGL